MYTDGAGLLVGMTPYGSGQWGIPLPDPSSSRRSGILSQITPGAAN